jgi:seryl-tRNA synthetase
MSDDTEHYRFLHVEPMWVRQAVKRRTSDELLADQVYQLANDRLRHVNATKRLNDEIKRLWERLQVHEPLEPPRPPSRHGKPGLMSDG